MAGPGTESGVAPREQSQGHEGGGWNVGAGLPAIPRAKPRGQLLPTATVGPQEAPKTPDWRAGTQMSPGPCCRMPLPCAWQGLRDGVQRLGQLDLLKPGSNPLILGL